MTDKLNCNVHSCCETFVDNYLKLRVLKIFYALRFFSGSTSSSLTCWEELLKECCWQWQAEDAEPGEKGGAWKDGPGRGEEEGGGTVFVVLLMGSEWILRLLLLCCNFCINNRLT